MCLLVLDVSSSFLIISNLQRNKIYQYSVFKVRYIFWLLSQSDKKETVTFAFLYHCKNFFEEIRQPPTLPCRLQHSTIGRPRLNRRVRDGNGCFPRAHRHRKISNCLLRHARPSLPSASSGHLVLGCSPYNVFCCPAFDCASTSYASIESIAWLLNN